MAAGLAQLSIRAGPQRQRALHEFLRALRTWSRSYNLVAAGDLDHLVARHVLDSLSIRAHLRAGNLLDVATGAGFPGIPLAICDPRRDVTLVDSAGKKIRFVRHVVRELSLANVTVVQERAQNFSPGVEFSNIVARAFTTLTGFAECVRHLAGPDTRMLAMKGRKPIRELEELPAWVTVESVLRLEVPGLDAERHLVTMTVADGMTTNTDNSRWPA